ncbi:CUB and sushi domain-containing protein 1-like [Porites lutea]|uniref:CUB and sushi domain-containing protein 1-like n=1 Tax=Porites lutea TaxID=51062 RepID=UPI003CC5DB7C
MQDKRIPDNDITSSSELSANHAPVFARLDGPSAWCSAPGDQSPYIQITWDEENLITAITTQGSFRDFSWARNFEVAYMRDEKWTSYKKILKGNRNSRSLKNNVFKPPIKTRSIRIYPKDPFGFLMDSTVPVVPCLRLELYGCSAPASCDPLQTLRNGKIHKNGNENGALVSFSCNEGFKLQGLRQIRCVQGKWNGSIPTCEGNCKNPEPFANGSIIGEDYSSGSSIQFRCNVGYQLLGSEKIACVNGTWSETIPECTIVKCGDPGKPSNGEQIVKKGYVYGGSVKFVCDKNCTLVGTDVIYCQANGSWSSPVPRCFANCQSPGDINHGLQFGNNYTHGKTVRYFCNPGYTLEGEVALTCEDGRWNTDTPKCKAVECDDPGKPSNGEQIVKKGYVYGGSVKFVCDKNYTLVGTDVIYCQANRSWSSFVPRCLANCRSPGVLNNGLKIGKNYTHGKTVRYSCNLGYTLEGEAKLTCVDGRWNTTTPKCKAVECGNPGKPTNGKQIVRKGYVYGGSVKFVCDENYTVVGADVMFCQANKSWSSSVPRCVADCRSPGDINHGLKIGNNYKHGKTVQYSCNPGFTLEGEAEVTCEEGTWNTDTPKCKAVECGDPGKPTNGEQIVTKGYVYGGSVKFVCDKNYSLVGTDVIYCQANRSWSSAVPRCLGCTGQSFQSHCHSGWLLIARFSNNDGKNWMKDSGDWWYDQEYAIGATTDPSVNADMISSSFWQVKGGEFKITRSDDSSHTPLLQTTGNCLGGRTFRSKITSYGDFRNGKVWSSNRCLGSCTVQYGGQYKTTNGFQQAECSGNIQSSNKIGFWCDWSSGDGSVIMIGGGGSGCNRADHGIGITEQDGASFVEKNSDETEYDFGYLPAKGSGSPSQSSQSYSLNLWIR